MPFMTAYRFGDIVLIGFPHTDLRGSSKRPAIVLYDAGDQDILVARLTTQEYSTEGDYRVSSWQQAGLLAQSYVRLGKLATIDKRYVIKQLGAMETRELEKVKSILRKIFALGE